MGLQSQLNASCIRASSDADCANYKLDRKSIKGEIIKYNLCPLAVHEAGRRISINGICGTQGSCIGSATSRFYQEPLDDATLAVIFETDNQSALDMVKMLGNTT